MLPASHAADVKSGTQVPWALAFSFSRAIQQSALEVWRGKDAYVAAAQQALFRQAECKQSVGRGEYCGAIKTL